MRRKPKKQSICGLALEVIVALALVLILTPTTSHAEMDVFPAIQSTSQDQPVPAGQEEIVEEDEALPDEGSPGPDLVQFTATAYCLRGTTAAGVRVNPGSVAADPRILPLGSVIRVYGETYSGIYTVMDTGAKVRGRRLDFWLPSYQEAIEFGVRKVKIEILRYGWEPTEQASNY